MIRGYGPSQLICGPSLISSQYNLLPRILVHLSQILLFRDKFLISTVFKMADLFYSFPTGCWFEQTS